MARASQWFTDEDKKAVSEAVAEAEKQTSGEIVPVVATRSGRYDRAEDLFGVLVGLVAVSIVWALCQGIRPAAADWQSEDALALGLGWVLFTFAAAFVAGVVLSTFVPLLARPLVGKREREEEVMRSAQQAFHEFRVRGTEAATGILIYVSLFERMVAVIGDQAIAEKLDQEQWEDVKALVIAGLREGKPAEGICKAVKRCGELLSEHFPIAPDDVNELSNELHVID